MNGWSVGDTLNAAEYGLALVILVLGVFVLARDAIRAVRGEDDR